MSNRNSIHRDHVRRDRSRSRAAKRATIDMRNARAAKRAARTVSA